MDTVGCKTLGWCFDRRFTRFVPYLTFFLFDPHFAHLFCILIKSKPECKEQMVSLLFKASLSGKVAVRDLKDFSELHPAHESLLPMQRCFLKPSLFRRPRATLSEPTVHGWVLRSLSITIVMKYQRARPTEKPSAASLTS